MYGVFGGYTRWAVVFLIIFVLFFLLVPMSPVYGGMTTCGGYVTKDVTDVSMTKFQTYGAPGMMYESSPYSYESASS